MAEDGAVGVGEGQSGLREFEYEEQVNKLQQQLQQAEHEVEIGNRNFTRQLHDFTITIQTRR